MPRRIPKHAAKTHHHLHKHHCNLCERFSWYDWWHKQDIHVHIHYAALTCGIVVAVYYVMLEEIFSKVNL